MAEEEVKEEKKSEEETPELTPPEAPPPLVTPPDETEERHWRSLAIYAILALLVAIGVVFGGRWIYHQFNKPATKPAPTRPTSPPSTAPSTPTKPSPTPSPIPSTSQGQPAAGQGGQIANTGPGDVVAIFIAASLAAAALHYIITLRRPS